MKNKFTTRLEEFFKYYKEEQACVLCSDGTIFLTKNKQYASRHANDMNEQIAVVTREEVFPPVVVPTSPVEGIQEDLTLLTVAQLKERATTSGIDIPKKATKAEIIALIEAASTVAGRVEEDYSPVNDD